MMKTVCLGLTSYPILTVDPLQMLERYLRE